MKQRREQTSHKKQIAKKNSDASSRLTTAVHLPAPLRCRPLNVAPCVLSPPFTSPLTKRVLRKNSVFRKQLTPKLQTRETHTGNRLKLGPNMKKGKHISLSQHPPPPLYRTSRGQQLNLFLFKSGKRLHPSPALSSFRGKRNPCARRRSSMKRLGLGTATPPPFFLLLLLLLLEPAAV